MKKVWLICLITAVLISTLIGCAPSPTTTPPTTTPPTTTPPTTTPPTTTPPTTIPPTTTPPSGSIKVGVLLELTGFLAPLGDEIQKSLAVSLDVLGSTVAGRQVEFIKEDTASDANTTLDKARKLVETDKVAMLMGPVHGGTRLALAGYLDRAQIPDVGVAEDEIPVILEHNWMWSRGNEVVTSFPTGIWAYQDQGYRTATILADERETSKEYIQGFKDSFIPLGGQIIQEQYYPNTTQDFTPYIVQLRQADVLVTWIGDVPGFAAFPQLKFAGNTMPILQTENGGLILSPGAAPQMGDSIYGIVTSALYLNTLTTPLNREFVDAYQAEYGVLPGPFAGQTFASVQIIYQALKTSGGDTSPQALAAALSKPVDTICGHYEWTPQRMVIGPVYLVKIGNDGLPSIIQTNVVTGEKVGDTLVPKIVG